MGVERVDKPDSYTVLFIIDTDATGQQEIEVPAWDADKVEAYFALKTDDEITSELAKSGKKPVITKPIVSQLDK